jgi:hypothetical protein
LGGLAEDQNPILCQFGPWINEPAPVPHEYRRKEASFAQEVHRSFDGLSQRAEKTEVAEVFSAIAVFLTIFLVDSYWSGLCFIACRSLLPCSWVGERRRG